MTEAELNACHAETMKRHQAPMQRMMADLVTEMALVKAQKGAGF